jgi:thiol-disulfide isomerase/thioredoxin
MRRLVVTFAVAVCATGFAVAQKKDPVKPAAATAAAAVAPASLSELNDKFDKAAEEATKKVALDRLAALEGYVADKKNADKADVLDARLQAAELAYEHDKFEAAKTHAEKALELAKASKDEKAAGKATGAKLTAGRAHSKLGSKAEVVVGYLAGVVEATDGGDQSTWGSAIEATQALADFHVGAGDKAAATKAWEALTDKIAHEGVGEMARGEMDNIKQIGEEPKAFPEGAKDRAGKALSLADYKGKVLLIDFWATWCGPCMQEMPNVVEAYKKFNAKGFEIVGISLDNEKSIERMDDVMKSKGMTWRQFADGKGWQNEISQLYGVQSIPATYLLDRNGKVHRMNLRGADLHKAVEKLLAETAKK